MSSEKQLSSLRDSAKLPVSHLDHSQIVDPEPSFWQRHRLGLSVSAIFLGMVFLGSWIAMNTIRPFSSAIDIDILNQELVSLHSPAPIADKAKNPKQSPNPPKTEPVNPQTTTEQTAVVSTSPANIPESKTLQVKTWRPNSDQLFWDPQDSPNVGDSPTRVFVVTIKAKVTAYTPYDHAVSHPEWADGNVAWHPRNRKRSVNQHPYCLATDWTQFPGGSTFISVPGYMDKSFPNFPEKFRVVDDKCGRARRDNRQGSQPVIDVRYLTRHSAISGRNAWGMKQLNVDVIFPANFSIPKSLQPWIVKAEWRTYKDGKVIARKSVY